MEFLVWHLLAICSVMGVSFLLGYLTGKKEKNGSFKRW